MALLIFLLCDTGESKQCVNTTTLKNLPQTRSKNVSTAARDLTPLAASAKAQGWRFSGLLGWTCPACAQIAQQQESDIHLKLRHAARG